MTIKAGVFAGLRVQLANTRSCGAVLEWFGGWDQTSDVPDLPDLSGRRNDSEIPQTETSGTFGLQNLHQLPAFGCTVPIVKQKQKTGPIVDSERRLLKRTQNSSEGETF